MPKTPTHTQAILSIRHGGHAQVKTYCLYFMKQPREREKNVLCAGQPFWSPCPDYVLCLRQPIQIEPVYNTYWIRKLL